MSLLHLMLYSTVLPPRHIREHMEGMLNAEELDKVKLDSSEEMEFHYFKLHDYDNNNKLDGLELAAAMTHYHESGPDENQKVSESWQTRHSVL